MKFWLPLAILLTTLSPKLNAETINPLDAFTVPWEFDVQLYNVNTQLAYTDWSGTLMNFNTPQIRSYGALLTGTFDFAANGQPFDTAYFFGDYYEGTNQVAFATLLPGIPVLLSGIITDDLNFMIGRLDAFGRSDMTGFWAASPVDLPSALGLFLFSIGAIAIFAKKTV